MLCKCLQKGCVCAHVTISSEWQSIIEYRAPSDTMIAGSHHFSPDHVITFKRTGSFSHQLADDREHHRASLGKTPRSFSILTSVILITHCQNPVWFVFESIYMPHREYLVVPVVLFPYSVPMSYRPMNHSFFFMSSLVIFLIEWFMKLAWLGIAEYIIIWSKDISVLILSCFKWWPLNVATFTNLK